MLIMIHFIIILHTRILWLHEIRLPIIIIKMHKNSFYLRVFAYTLRQVSITFQMQSIKRISKHCVYFRPNDKTLIVPFSKRQKSAVIPALSSSGGADRDRTDYLLTASQALSQVSYNPSAFIIDADRLSVNCNIFCPAFFTTLLTCFSSIAKAKTAVLS